ncbi:hypothetical protein [Flagellimonas sp. W118]|uniref:hypothetical protein n=1 Tax=Flagellimonas sp. W118 TaxID=3410791 RepID=UPI003BF49AD2
MKLLKTLFDFYLNASVHVAFAVVSLILSTIVLLGISPNSSLLGFTFFGTIVCYNFVKYGVEAEKYLIVSNTYHRSIQVFSFVCFVPALYFLFQLDQEIWMVLLILSLISALYAIPFLPNAKNLRSLGGFKIYIVALVWVGFTVFLPILDQQAALTWDIWVLFCQRFVLVIVLLLPFEIRDLKWDSKALKTLPQVIGIERTKRLGIFLTILWFLFTFLKDELYQTEIWSRFVVSLILLVVFFYGKNMQKNYLVSFWVEGIPIIWCGILWLLIGFG